MTTQLPTHDDLIRRAMAAWYKAGGGYPIHEQPARPLSTVESAAGHEYAVLRNVRGVMTVYRVRNNGALKRLVRIPKEFQESAE